MTVPYHMKELINPFKFKKKGKPGYSMNENATCVNNMCMELARYNFKYFLSHTLKISLTKIFILILPILLLCI